MGKAFVLVALVSLCLPISSAEGRARGKSVRKASPMTKLKVKAKARTKLKSKSSLAHKHKRREKQASKSNLLRVTKVKKAASTKKMAKEMTGKTLSSQTHTLSRRILKLESNTNGSFVTRPDGAGRNIKVFKARNRKIDRAGLTWSSNISVQTRLQKMSERIEEIDARVYGFFATRPDGAGRLIRVYTRSSNPLSTPPPKPFSSNNASSNELNARMQWITKQVERIEGRTKGGSFYTRPDGARRMNKIFVERKAK
jgi:hypothetical protein